MRLPLILTLCLTQLLTACSPGSESRNYTSPTGRFTIKTNTEESHVDPRLHGCVVIEIRDKTGAIIHNENTHASSFHKWHIEWISDDEFTVYSSDIGTYKWTRNAAGKWESPHNKPAA